MPSFRELMERILANGRVEGHELEVLHQQLYANGKIDRPSADLLVELHKRVQYPTPGFEQFFWRAMKDHILAAGRITTTETAWLRQLLLGRGVLDEEARQFLHELRGEARQAGPEFQALFEECMRLPQAQHTSGG